MTEEEITEGKHGMIDGNIDGNIETGEFYKTEVERGPSLERLAKDIYEKDEETIRELLSNSFTSVMEAVERGYIEEDEMIVKVRFESRGGESKLIIYDNGIGITKERFKALRKAGLSTNRTSKDKAGQFGIGYYSAFQIVDDNGIVKVHTNPRKDGEENITYLSSLDGFKEVIDDRDKFPEHLGDDEYGTKLEIPLKDDVSPGSYSGRHTSSGKSIDYMHDVVEKYSELSRVDVEYKEIINGEIQNEDTFESRNLEYYYYDDAYVTLENEYFKVVYGYTKTDNVKIENDHFIVRERSTKIYTYDGGSVSSKTVLIDVPIKRNSSMGSRSDAKLSIRLKTESKTVLTGDNRGKVIVSEGELKNLDDKDRFVTEEEVDERTVYTPSTSGSRRELESNDKFWNHVKRKVKKKLMEKASELNDKVDTLDDFFALHPGEQKVYMEKVRKNLEGPKRDNFDRLNDKQAYMIESYRKYLDTDVYMFCHNSSRKYRDVVVSHDENSIFINVNESRYYDVYKNLLGWKVLHKIKHNLDEYDAPESLKEKARPSGYKSAGKDQLTLHTSGGQKQTKRVGVNNVGNDYEVVVFPDHMSKNVSSYYELSEHVDGLAVAKCSKSDYERIKERDNVKLLEEKIEEQKPIKLLTRENDMVELEELTDKDTAIIKTTKDKQKSLLVDDVYYEGMLHKLGIDNVDYVVVTTKDLTQFYPILEHRGKNKVRLYTVGVETPLEVEERKKEISADAERFFKKWSKSDSEVVEKAHEAYNYEKSSNRRMSYKSVDSEVALKALKLLHEEGYEPEDIEKQAI